MTDATPKSKAVAILAARIARFPAQRHTAPKGLLSQLGPGLITGASDDDPSVSRRILRRARSSATRCVG